VVNPKKKQQFQATVWANYRIHKRQLPWRETDQNTRIDPYKIFVSEMMLQQTQVSRVIAPYHEFILKFPSLTTLAAADLATVLTQWQGLGYNRRAKYLWESAKIIQHKYDGIIPRTTESLCELPGIGSNTAGAIVVYAFNQPVVFVETNIRSVYIHHFFANQTKVDDKQVQRLVLETMDENNPRGWYWALRDYGSQVKKRYKKINHASTTYRKQSSFLGSKRQLRGRVLRALNTGPHTMTQLQSEIEDDRLKVVLGDLVSENLISKTNNHFKLGV
jgi:A/G-specific adenine glycosylase